ncbi:hypothetical protein PIB30_067627 [Stylosanthes scabra]|uniref:Aminotransferase-like plant mobile domain-containing protein n=1 Tax=Stylosanthes scabra TaxID=79078 RepID=A0ABU6VPI1_9FABA|nr:hypothetical protein [Stylosanthes scabra]
MPWIAPILRHELEPPQVPLANRWTHWPRYHDYRLKPVRAFRKEIDDITLPYGGMVLPNGLHENLPVSKYFGSFLSFECVERHSANRVMCQFGYNQTRPTHPEDLGEDYCITLRGTQHHDWSDLLSTWVEKWQNHEQTCLRGQLVISFENHDRYMQWYKKRFGQWLSLVAIA